ncbi:MAG: peptidoglycan DD-metalloendopeptidase family protein [Christensenellales bacterium]|jgi:murein DD-endopeptidase MepM/ murein hydrolase activator NlpD
MNPNNNSPNKKAGWTRKVAGFMDKHGFYVVLALCLVIIAVTAIATMGGVQAPDADDTEVQYIEGGGLEEQLKESPPKSAAATPSPSVSPAPTVKPTIAPVKPKSSLVKPVEGEVTVIFATKTLIYNKTLKQWMTHNGVDIAAKDGADVKAVAAGSVESVEESALLGNKVTIKHENGHVSVYASLTDVKAKSGQKVKQGDVMAKAGKTAIAEYDEGTHLHFEYIIDGKHVDPLEYITGYTLSNSAAPTTESPSPKQ